MKPLWLTIGLLIAVSMAGCQEGQKKSPLEQELDTLKSRNKHLALELEQAKAETDQLKDRIGALRTFENQGKTEDIYTPRKIRISRFTNLYDKDNDGKKEKLIVYVQPTDSTGDVIKAPGAVDVQLWDLNRQSTEALLGKWRIEPNHLKLLWYASMLGTNYRLTFDAPDSLENVKSDLTVKVTFTDYLTGKVLTEQHVFRPQ